MNSMGLMKQKNLSSNFVPKPLLMKSYISPKVTKQTSKIAGKGIFAREVIGKHEIVAIKMGHVMERDEFIKLGGFNGKIGEFVLQIDDTFFIGPRNEKEIEASNVGVNHSCKGNIGFLGNVISITMRDIKKGEELVNDYATWISDSSFKMSCECGQDMCRKIVTANDWKNTELQQEYKGYFQAYLQKKIEDRF